ncbi:UNVERIFIED_CONTAM: hypothetical protein FKN15_004918 [Acipenser sinensis]
MSPSLLKNSVITSRLSPGSPVFSGDFERSVELALALPWVRETKPSGTVSPYRGTEDTTGQSHGDITQKGYEKKRAKLLAPYIPQIQGVDPSLQIENRIQGSSQPAPAVNKQQKSRSSNSRDERFRSDVHTEAVQAALAKYKERKMPMPSKRRSVLVQSSVEACTPPGATNPSGCNLLHLVSESVGAPTTLGMETIEKLIAKIKRNIAAQQEQNKKWRVELGLPEPEPTELDRLLQKWKGLRIANGHYA